MTFDELYARFKGPVWRLSRRLTGSEEEALDASQEIFIRIWRGLSGFRGEAKLSTWVFQIAWNYLRGLRRRRVRSLEIVTGDREGCAGPCDGLADPAPNPERRAQAVDLLARVDEVLQALPEHHRVVLLLRDGEDLSYEEIATVLDVPIGTVRSRLARARAALRRAVEM